MKNVNVVNGVQVLSTNPDNLGQVSIEPGSFEMVADDKFTTINDGIVDISGEYRINGTPIGGGGGIPNHSEQDGRKIDATNEDGEFKLTTHNGENQEVEFKVSRRGLEMGLSTTDNNDKGSLSISPGSLNFSATNNDDSISLNANYQTLQINSTGEDGDEAIIIFDKNRLWLIHETRTGTPDGLMLDPHGIICNDIAVPAGIIPLNLDWTSTSQFGLYFTDEIKPAPFDRLVKICISVSDPSFARTGTTANWSTGLLNGNAGDGAQQFACGDTFFNCNLYANIPANETMPANEKAIGVLFSTSIADSSQRKFPSRVFAEVYLQKGALK